MTRFTDSPYERMMTRREGNFPSSFFTPKPPLLWLRELWKPLCRFLS